uniref:Uncharacterized protein n=1 Tax=Glossina austeni TaxID=7395 RepID=A0A1A9V0T2_GLOAU
MFTVSLDITKEIYEFYNDLKKIVFPICKTTNKVVAKAAAKVLKDPKLIPIKVTMLQCRIQHNI